MRLVARTFSIEEAMQIAHKYGADGHRTKIVENKKGSVISYEVWVEDKPLGKYL